MSSAEPFMPSHEPAAAPDPAEHDLDADVDVPLDPHASSPEEIAAAEAAWARAAKPSFRTPTPGAHLSARELADELEADAPENGEPRHL